MQRAVVTRIYGDQNIGGAIANAIGKNIEVQTNVSIDAEELERLRSELGVRKCTRDKNEYTKKIKDVRRKYHVEPMTGIKKRYWQFIGTIVLLITSEWE